MTDRRRQLPSVNRLLELPEVARLLQAGPRNLVVAAVRDAVDHARRALPDAEFDWAAEIAERVRDRRAPSLFPVINATGVVLHTNLGRAPLAEEALTAALQVGRGYSNLELDVATGARGSRLDHCAALLAETCGAEDGMAVNNAAGALVLALNAVANGREVIISRGELVEIGGSFRIPDILEKSGAVLREIGTTNRTHTADYRNAISDRTGAILVVHRSNFAMTGFVASPPIEELGALARSAGVPLLHDVGSGLLADLSAHGLTGEPRIHDATPHADLVLFSGDKLLGGPQAGCIVGRRAAVAPLRKNPYARALRADKMTLAALEATLALYRDPAVALARIPVLRMLSTPAAELAACAARLREQLADHFAAALEPGQSAVGGGSFPEAPLPTTLVSLDPGSRGAHSLALSLRLGHPSVLVRIEGGRVVIDPRTLAPEDEAPLVEALARAAQG